MTHILNTIVSIAIISIALLLFLVSLLLGITAANITGVIIFVLTGIAAIIGFRTRSWNWTATAGIALIIGWVVIYSANMGSL